MSRELKPCPFCGGKAEVRTKYIEKETKDVPVSSYVRCTRCFAHSDEFLYKNTEFTLIDPAEEAIKAWNRREVTE